MFVVTMPPTTVMPILRQKYGAGEKTYVKLLYLFNILSNPVVGGVIYGDPYPLPSNEGVAVFMEIFHVRERTDEMCDAEEGLADRQL